MVTIHLLASGKLLMEDTGQEAVVGQKVAMAATIRDLVNGSQ